MIDQLVEVVHWWQNIFMGMEGWMQSGENHTLLQFSSNLFKTFLLPVLGPSSLLQAGRFFGHVTHA